MNTSYIVPQTVYQLGSIRRITQRLGAARFNYRFLDRGSARMVFDLDNGSVLKLAHNRKGIAQNKQESDPRLKKYYGLYVVPILAADPLGSWLIQQKADQLTEVDFQNFLHTPDGIRLQRKLRILSRLEGLTYWDLIGQSNLGKVDGKVLVMDYGLTDAIYAAYYDPI